MEQYIAQIVVGYVMPFVLELVKKAPWFPVYTESALRWVKVAFSWIVAAASVCAVSFAFDSAQGQLVVSGLTWNNAWGGLQQFVLALMTQKMTYKIAVQGDKG